MVGARLVVGDLRAARGNVLAAANRARARGVLPRHDGQRIGRSVPASSAQSAYAATATRPDASWTLARDPGPAPAHAPLVRRVVPANARKSRLGPLSGVAAGRDSARPAPELARSVRFPRSRHDRATVLGGRPTSARKRRPSWPRLSRLQPRAPSMATAAVARAQPRQVPSRRNGPRRAGGRAARRPAGERAIPP